MRTTTRTQSPERHLGLANAIVFLVLGLVLIGGAIRLSSNGEYLFALILSVVALVLLEYGREALR